MAAERPRPPRAAPNCNARSICIACGPFWERETPSQPAALRQPALDWHGLAALVLFAAMVRFIGLDCDQHHLFHPDERAIADAVGRLSFDPSHCSSTRSSSPTARSRSTRQHRHQPGLANIDPPLRSYDGVILIGARRQRRRSARSPCCCSSCSGRGSTTSHVGLLAGVLLAACVLHVQNSHFWHRRRLPDLHRPAVALSFSSARPARRAARLPLRRPGHRPRRRHQVQRHAPAGAARRGHPRPPLRRAPLRCRCFGNGVAALLGGRPPRFVCAASPTPSSTSATFSRQITEQSHMVRNAGLFPYTNQYIGTPKYVYDLDAARPVGHGAGPRPGGGVGAAASGRSERARDRSGAQLGAAGLGDAVLPGHRLVRGEVPPLPAADLPDHHPVGGGLAVRRYGAALAPRASGAVDGWSARRWPQLLAFLSIYQRPHTVVHGVGVGLPQHPGRQQASHPALGRGLPVPLPGIARRTSTRSSSSGYYEPASIQDAELHAQQLAEGRLHRLPDQAALRRADPGAAEVPADQQLLLPAVRRRPRLHADPRRRLAADPVRHRASRRAGGRVDHRLRPPQGPDLPEHRPPERRRALREDHARPSVEAADPRPTCCWRGRRRRRRRAAATRPARSAPACLALLMFAMLVEVLGLAPTRPAAAGCRSPAATPSPRCSASCSSPTLPWLLVSLGRPTSRAARCSPRPACWSLLGLRWRGAAGCACPCAPSGAATEALFWGVFVFFLVVRAFNPEIFWGEKPMDFSFLNALYARPHAAAARAVVLRLALYYTLLRALRRRRPRQGAATSTPASRSTSASPCSGR